MFSFTRFVLKQFPYWDKPSQVGFVLAVILLVVLIVVTAFLPQESRQSGLLALGALLFVTQAIILWANRGMVRAYTAAQRHFLAGDFETARTVLEAGIAKGENDANTLTLLGNTYRQLGELGESERILRLALEKRPDHHFSLYGFGRTLLVMGEYAQAATVIQSALDLGAPSVVRVDLGEALYRLGDTETARQVLESATADAAEPHRQLWLAYLRYRLGMDDAPPPQLVESGLAFWQASAERFGHTPYGVALRDDLAYLETLV